MGNKQATYTVGKFYNVPTVNGFVYDIRANWPVIGPMHQDAEIINFHYRHYHIDWRFVSDRLLNDVHWHTQIPYGTVLHADRYGQRVLPKPIMRRLKCKRDFTPYPAHKATWLPELEKAHKGCKLKPGMVCPHRGVPLASIPGVNGIVTCPAHGLKWNVATGELVSNEGAR